MGSTSLTIAGSTLTFAVRVREKPAWELGPHEWAAELGELRTAGFKALDLVDSWLTPGLMSESALRELRTVVDDSDLELAGVSVIRRSVIDPAAGEENLAFTLRSVEASASLGAPIVSIGFHGPLTARQKEWPFWMVPGHQDARDQQTWDLAAKRVGLVAARAAELGMEISLELHEGTLLDTPAGAVRIIEQCGAANIGINPDLGNLVRVPTRPSAGWVDLLMDSLPYMNYWHVKNYLRLDHPDLGAALSYPTDLEFGLIDYRAALRLALAHGYDGPLCIEHYEGDAMWAIERGRRYLEEVMRQLQVAEDERSVLDAEAPQ